MVRDPGIIGGALAGRAREMVRAEMALIEARERLRVLQEKALLRGGYDPDAYDEAITEYREARSWATIVRAAWRLWQAEHDRAESAALRGAPTPSETSPAETQRGEGRP